MDRDVWVIRWLDDDGWEVELFARNGVCVTITWDQNRDGCCTLIPSRENREWQAIPWPWPDCQPMDPAIVLAEAKRLADEYLTPIPPATSGNPQQFL